MQKNSNNFSKNADLLVNVNFAVEQSRAFPLLSMYNSPYIGGIILKGVTALAQKMVNLR
jgi:hypothetical protein